MGDEGAPGAGRTPARPGREALGARFRRAAGEAPVDWALSPGPVPYEAAVAAMEARAAAVAAGEAPELAWLLEHPALYTAGTGARPADLLDPALPVHASGRGGQYTYHGPGQRVAYLVLDLRARRPDLRAFVAALEAWVILALGDLGVAAERREDRVGAWVPRPGRGEGAEDKVAAVGVRVRRWVSLHGVSLNVAPDLAHYAGIVPCGVRGPGVTSLADLGRPAPMARVDAALRARFGEVFGPSRDAPAPPLPLPPPPLAAAPPAPTSPA